MTKADFKTMTDSQRRTWQRKLRIKFEKINA